MVERATLVLNHVLAGESVATQRLTVHTGRCIRLQFQGWPAWLPSLPDATFRITPAGLLEWCGNERAEATEVAALRIDIDVSNPALLALKGLAGERPQIGVAGDAALATDVNWLFDNLRWDIVDDLESLVGPAAAQQLGQLGAAIAASVRAMARSVVGSDPAGQGGDRSRQPMP